MSNENQMEQCKVAPDVWRIKDIMVNLYIVRNPMDDTWVIIDAGLKTAFSKIKNLASELFGANSRPAAVLLTHGHFDHVGAVESLIKEWNIPVYAHYLEVPYLTGKSDYPPADPSVHGGLMADLSFLYPTSPIDIHQHLHLLPQDGSVPFLFDWKYIFTPGHAPGHVSFFREKDKVLIAGDAIITTNQSSVLAVLQQKIELSGPPKYFTYDWGKAKESFQKLADLKPLILATGHGKTLSGGEMESELQNLSKNFDRVAVPKHGRYVNNPAIVDSSGVVFVPPKKSFFG